MTDVDVVVEHRPGAPVYDEPPYPRRCIGCGEGWPCASARAARDEEAEERAARAHHPHVRSEVDGKCNNCGFSWPCPVASRRRSLEQLEITLRSIATFGCHLEAFEGNSWQATKGGMVVEVSIDDNEHQVFTVLEWHRGGGPYTVDIDLDDVEPASLALPRLDHMRDQARRLAGWVKEQNGPADGFEVRWLQIAVSLMEAAT